MSKPEPPRKTPEEWLRKAESAEAAESGELAAPRRGRMKVFLGYAPGVGKTFSMLSEGIRRSSRGEDVMIGVVETHGRAGTAEVAEKLERVPLQQIDYKGTLFTEMNVDAILARRPQVVIVDELAHTNIESSRNRKRYEDVFLLLENHIDVLTTLNVQHIESLTPRVEALTGVTVRETVPDWVLDRADEIVMSDLTPEALAKRMRRGDIYPLDRAERALANFFRRGNLIALREMALQRVTRAVDRTLDDYVKQKQLGNHWILSEKVGVAVSANPAAKDLIARGARLSQLLNGEFYILHLDNERGETPESVRALEDNFNFATNLGAQVCHVKGGSVAEATARFALEHKITQMFFGRSALSGLRKYIYFREIARFVSIAPHVDLHIITQEAR